MWYKNLGAYTVRYSRACGIIYGFSLSETENLEKRFLLGRALEGEGFRTFLTLALKPAKAVQFKT